MQIASVEDFVVIADVEASLVEQVGAAGRTLLADGFGTPTPCTVTSATDPTDGIAVVATVDETGAVSYEVA